MSAPNPLAVMRARSNRLAVEAAPRWYQSDTRYTGHMVAVVSIAHDGAEQASVEYVQQSTGAVLTVGDLESSVEWQHEGHDAVLETYALVEKPKRVMVACFGCGARWDEKR